MSSENQKKPKINKNKCNSNRNKRYPNQSEITNNILQCWVKNDYV